ncbi:cell adhesion molecule CEACAM5-like isoform X4 [Salvelinus alpinus]|uniref:cell adhesion molecule CEACAM5-like isoform X4 n=1 Tax=Salvelinus alpinus TaxID=8036 RepID=UPI0039FD6C79
MSKLTLIRLCFWLYLVRTVVSKEDLYHQVEGELVLTPDKSTVPDSITSIVWKHGKDKVAEWDKDFGGLDIYEAFKERTTLNQTTGELRISGLMKTDSGVYSVEFNSKLLDKTYKLSVIKAVPKPTITSSCNANKTSCTLTCEGNTTDAEPVTYSWKVGERASDVVDKQMIVSKSDSGKLANGYKYTCKLNNTVSEEVSEPVGEVFGPEAVPKPTITSSCNPDKTSCTLICEGDTTDAEPVTYSWKVGEGEWKVIGKQLIVSKSDSGKLANGYQYTCKLKNAVSEEVSEPVGQVFGPEPFNIGAVIALVVVTIVAIVTGLLVWKKKKGSDVVQPEQGKGNADKAEKGKGKEGGDDKTETNGSAAPGGDLNAAEKGEANGEGSVLLNEDTGKYDNGEGAAEENSPL